MEPPRAAEKEGAVEQDTADETAARRVPIAARHYLWVIGAAIVFIAALHWL